MHINHQTYQGPTLNPLADLLDRRIEHFSKAQPEQMRSLWRKWGLCGAADRRRTIWNEFSQRERAVFVTVSGYPDHYCEREWDQLDNHQQERLWRAVQSAATWSDRVKSCANT